MAAGTTLIATAIGGALTAGLRRALRRHRAQRLVPAPEQTWGCPDCGRPLRPVVFGRFSRRIRPVAIDAGFAVYGGTTVPETGPQRTWRCRRDHTWVGPGWVLPRPDHRPL